MSQAKEPSSSRDENLGKETPWLPIGLRRHASIILAVGLGICLVGLLRGFQHRPLPPPPPSPQLTKGSHPDIPDAVAYSDLPGVKVRPNDNWHASLSDLRFDRPGTFDPVVRTEEMKLAALADRAHNRAYDGAPPTIPHAVEGTSEAACLSCHEQGVKVADRIATKVCHPAYGNCLQCHVESARTQLSFRGPAPDNTFSGRERAGPGARAWPGAPPTIPHPTWMRQDCSSCHGVIARAGIRTTHPWLTNCVQCHAPSAELDQVAFPIP